jgi:hypothetical protein
VSHEEHVARLAVETSKKDSPVLGLHRVSLVSFSAPVSSAASVSRRGDLSSLKERCDIFSPDLRRTGFEASCTNLRPVTRQIANAIALRETFSSDIF